MRYSTCVPFLSVLLLFCCVLPVAAQNSHLGNLINAYKAQKNEEQQPVSAPVVAPPSPAGVLLRDPNASADDIINQPPAEEIKLANSSTKLENALLSRYPKPPDGNPKDPLKADFVPHLQRQSAQRHPAPIVTPYDEMLGDARLNDVCFVNPNCGWAVGDRGVIWHTEDGGQHWTLQETPISCTLHSVGFYDAQFGFAVGGYPFPYTSHGRGVILCTRDGGTTWSILRTDLLPILHRVQVFDTLKIIVAGESSERHPTGLFLSSDSGKTWRPQSGGKNDGWISLDMFDEKNGLGIDSKAVIQQYKNATQLSQTPSFGTSKPTQVHAVSDALQSGGAAGNINGWMVGSGGLVLSTLDRGQPGKLPGNSATVVDLNTIEVRGPKLWVAGNPGTLIYSSADLGKTWKATPSGTNAGIRRIVFADDKTGWAVGDLGTVLKTEDGGGTWRQQRSGGGRLAVLGIFGTAEDVPWETFAALCAHQGYLGGAALVFREQDKNNLPLESPWLDRVHEALIRTGATGLWELGPFRLERREMLRDSAHLLQIMEQENDNRGMQRLRERMVMLIRQWRPDVILTKTASQNGGNDPVRDLVLRELMEAVKISGDAKVYPYQMTELGLEPWSVKKVHALLEDGNLGDVNLTTTEPSIRFGQSYDELAFVSRGLLETSAVPAATSSAVTSPGTTPTLQSFLTAYDEMPPGGGKDFFAGISIAPASDARRGLTGSYVDYWDEIRHRIQQRRHVAGIIRNLGNVAAENGQSAGSVRLASNAAELTRKIDRDAAVKMLLELGQKYHVEGDWESACEAYEIVAMQYAKHPLARRAFLWLLQYQTAEEAGWRKHAGSVTVQAQTAFSVDKNGNTVAQFSNATGPSLNRQKLDPRLDKGLALGRYLNENLPDLRDDAPIRFAIASAQRRRGNLPEAVKFYKQRGKLEFDDLWAMRARSELWLGLGRETYGREELPEELREMPMASMVSTRVAKKPWLDGRFDQESDQGVWMQSKLYTLTPEKPRKRLQEMLKDKPSGGSGLKREERARAASKNFSTRVMFMHDQEYLYIGLRCPRVAGFSYPPIPEKPRSRDAAIDGQDRVEILLDVDRDYGTAYSITVDSRGWVVDACWGDKHWNPEFRVARYEDKDAWYIEAALAFSSLSDVPPLPGSAWNIGLRRIVPGVGIECWNAENSLELNEGLGPLFFE